MPSRRKPKVGENGKDYFGPANSRAITTIDKIGDTDRKTENAKPSRELPAKRRTKAKQKPKGKTTIFLGENTERVPQRKFSKSTERRLRDLLQNVTSSPYRNKSSNSRSGHAHTPGSIVMSSSTNREPTLFTFSPPPYAVSRKTGASKLRSKKRTDAPQNRQSSQIRAAGVAFTAASKVLEGTLLHPNKEIYKTKTKGRLSKQSNFSTASKQSGKSKFKITTLSGISRKKSLASDRMTSGYMRSSNKHKQSAFTTTSSSCQNVSGSVFLKHLNFRPITEDGGVGSTVSCGSFAPSGTFSGSKVNYQGWMKSNVSDVSSYTSYYDEGQGHQISKVKFEDAPEYTSPPFLDYKTAAGFTQESTKPIVPSHFSSDIATTAGTVESTISLNPNSTKEASRTCNNDLKISVEELSLFTHESRSVAVQNSASLGMSHRVSSDPVVSESVSARNKSSSCKEDGGGHPRASGSNASSCRAVKNFVISRSNRQQQARAGADLQRDGRFADASHTLGPTVDSQAQSKAYSEDETMLDRELLEVLGNHQRQRSTYGYCNGEGGAKPKRGTPHVSCTENSTTRTSPGVLDISLGVGESCTQTTSAHAQLSHSQSSSSKSTCSGSNSSSMSSENGSGGSLAQVLDELSMERLQQEFDLRLGKYMSLLCSQATEYRMSRRLHSRYSKQKRRAAQARLRRSTKTPNAVTYIGSTKSQSGETKKDESFDSRVERYAEEADDATPHCESEETTTNTFWFNKRNQHTETQTSTFAARPPVPRRPNSSPAKGSELSVSDRRGPTPSLRYVLHGKPPRSQTRKENKTSVSPGATSKSSDEPPEKRRSPRGEVNRRDRGGHTTPSRQSTPLKTKPPQWNAAAQTDNTGCTCGSALTAATRPSSSCHGNFLTAPTSPYAVEISGVSSQLGDPVTSVVCRASSPGSLNPVKSCEVSLHGEKLNVFITGESATVSSLNEEMSRSGTIRDSQISDAGVDDSGDKTEDGAETAQRPGHTDTVDAVLVDDDAADDVIFNVVDEEEAADEKTNSEAEEEEDLKKMENYNAAMGQCCHLLGKVDRPPVDEDSGSWDVLSDGVGIRRASAVTTVGGEEVGDNLEELEASGVSGEMHCGGQQNKVTDIIRSGESMGDSKPEAREINPDMLSASELSPLGKCEVVQPEPVKWMKLKRNNRRRASSALGNKTDDNTVAPGNNVRRSVSNPQHVEIVEFGNLENIRRLVAPEPAWNVKVTFDVSNKSNISDSIAASPRKENPDAEIQQKEAESPDEIKTEDESQEQSKKSKLKKKNKRNKVKRKSGTTIKPKGGLALATRERPNFGVIKITPMTSQLPPVHEQVLHETFMRGKHISHLTTRSMLQGAGSRPSSQMSWKTIETDTTTRGSPLSFLLTENLGGQKQKRGKKKKGSIQMKTKQTRNKVDSDVGTICLADGGALDSSLAASTKSIKKSSSKNTSRRRQMSLASQVAAHLANAVVSNTSSICKKRTRRSISKESNASRRQPQKDASPQGGNADTLQDKTNLGDNTPSQVSNIPENSIANPLNNPNPATQRKNQPRKRKAKKQSHNATSQQSLSSTSAVSHHSEETSSRISFHSVNKSSPPTSTRSSTTSFKSFKLKPASTRASSTLLPKKLARRNSKILGAANTSVLPTLPEHLAKISTSSSLSASHSLETLDWYRQEFLAYKTRHGRDSVDTLNDSLQEITSHSPNNVIRKCGPLVVALLIQFLVQYTCT